MAYVQWLKKKNKDIFNHIKRKGCSGNSHAIAHCHFQCEIDVIYGEQLGPKQHPM